MRVFPGEAASLYNQTLTPPRKSQSLGMFDAEANVSFSVEATVACHFNDFCPCLTVFLSSDSVMVPDGID